VKVRTTDDAWFRMTVERIADLVLAIDRDGMVVYANPAAAHLLGISPGEIVGRSCLDFVHPDDLERAIATIGYGTRSAQAEVPVTFRLRRGDRWTTFEIRGHGLGTDPRGETMLIVGRETNNSELLDELLDVRPPTPISIGHSSWWPCSWSASCGRTRWA
jgi:PAS domain S-box-containing protein